MRMLMKVSLPTETTNSAIKDGTFVPKIQEALGDAKPEAVYFTADEHGSRSALIFLDMKESSQMVQFAEPWFLRFNAKVSFQPVMSPQDLEAAGPHLERARELK